MSQIKPTYHLSICVLFRIRLVDVLTNELDILLRTIENAMISFSQKAGSLPVENGSKTSTLHACFVSRIATHVYQKFRPSHTATAVFGDRLFTCAVVRG